MGPFVRAMWRPARRNVWIVSRKHPPSVGGMESLSFHLAEALRRAQPTTVVAFGGGKLGLLWFLPYALGRVLIGLLCRHISAVYLGDPALAALGALARRFGVPVLVTVHGLDIEWPNRFYQLYLRSFFLGQCDVYVCISVHVRHRLQAFGVREDLIEVIPVGIALPPPEFEALPIEGDPVIAYLGRLVVRKGAAWFMREVMPALCRRFPRLVLVVAGEGPEYQAVADAARASGIQSHLRVLGKVPESTKWALYDRCDLVVMPNVSVGGDVEGFGLVALEASAMGKPVAASELEGLCDSVVPGTNGWRFPAGDAAAWIEGLTAILRDRGAMVSVGRRARVFASQFDWRIIGERHISLVARFAAK